MSLVPESKRLLALEKVIEKGRQTFVDVGCALAEIRDSKLYLCEHNTFEDYCREKWGWTKTYCNNLIQGASVVKSIPASVTTMVVNERQARELGKVEPEKRQEVIEIAAATGKVTAKSIKEAVENLSHTQSETTEAPPSQAPCGDEASSEAPAGHGQPAGLSAGDAAVLAAFKDDLEATRDKQAAIQLEEVVSFWLECGTKEQLRHLLDSWKSWGRRIEEALNR